MKTHEDVAHDAEQGCRHRMSRARAELDLRVGRMSCLHGLAEMLRQLYAARQTRAAEMLMDRCPRDALQALLDQSSAFLGSRVRYAVQDRLAHRKAHLDDVSVPTLRALAAVMNAWVLDGRRLAIRAVLRELDRAELAELAALPELHSEVASMTADFRSSLP
jgi:hypothetical protein